MNFLTAILTMPNSTFPSLTLSNEDSPTLSIGDDCLIASNGNPTIALAKFSAHSTEIVLTHLYHLLESQKDPEVEAFSAVLRLISDNDQSY